MKNSLRVTSPLCNFLNDPFRTFLALAVLSGTLAATANATANTYWNVFNIEGESSISASIVTYPSLPDMLADANRTGNFTPNPLGFGVNIVGSGSDGSTYWNVFNIEGESSISASIVTYPSLPDMLADANRTGNFTPNPSGFGANIVGSGSDGAPTGTFSISRTNRRFRLQS